MFIRWVLIAFLGCIAASPAISQTARRSTVSAAVPAPDDRARQWLTLVDDADYAKSYGEAGSAFRDGKDQAGWTASAAAMRGPLGAMVSRDLKSIDLGRSNAAILRYDSVFAHKASAIETVTLRFEKGGWSVTGYSIQ